MKISLKLLFASTVFLNTSCSTLNSPTPLKLLGDAASDTAAERTIVIDSQTRYVNVIGGEIIRFNVGTKSFTWHFDGAVNVTRFPLQQIAPAGLLDHTVTAYIKPNPFFIGTDRD